MHDVDVVDFVILSGRRANCMTNRINITVDFINNTDVVDSLLSLWAGEQIARYVE